MYYCIHSRLHDHNWIIASPATNPFEESGNARLTMHRGLF